MFEELAILDQIERQVVEAGRIPHQFVGLFRAGDDHGFGLHAAAAAAKTYNGAHFVLWREGRARCREYPED